MSIRASASTSRGAVFFRVLFSGTVGRLPVVLVGCYGLRLTDDASAPFVWQLKLKKERQEPKHHARRTGMSAAGRRGGSPPNKLGQF